MSWARNINDCEDPADWAYCTCAVYSCGYSQPNREQISEQLLEDGEAETDCSYGVSWWLWKGGYLDECPGFSTHWMIDYLTEHGYTLLEADGTSPIRNDVLWREGHTALYIGDGLQAEAIRTENHTAGYEGSEPGDQDDGETVVRPYPAGGWDYILRPPAPEPPAPPRHIVPDGGDGAVYRMYDGERHLFTLSRDEAQTLSDIGWADEGVGWRAPASGHPVRRLHNVWNGQHMLTSSDTEAIELVGLGWTYEGIGMLDGGPAEVYRLLNPSTGEHMFTADINEATALTEAGWTFEGVAFHAE